MKARRGLWILAAIVAFPFGFSEGCYRASLRRLPFEPRASPPAQLSELAREAIWLKAGESSRKRRITPLYPPILFFDRAAGERMAFAAARDMAPALTPVGGALDLNSVTWTLAIWLSRNLSADQLIDVLAEHKAFGRGVKGLQAAALVYFAKPLPDLTTNELIALVASPDPSRESYVSRDDLLAGLADAGFVSSEQQAVIQRQVVEVTPDDNASTSPQTSK